MPGFNKENFTVEALEKLTLTEDMNFSSTGSTRISWYWNPIPIAKNLFPLREPTLFEFAVKGQLISALEYKKWSNQQNKATFLYNIYIMTANDKEYLYKDRQGNHFFYIRQELCKNICPISISRVYICPPKQTYFI